jgi:DNA-binding beta-propeller fold protein YncE
MRLSMTSLLLLSSLAVAQPPSALSLKSRIALPNVSGRMDHFAVDVKGQRLFVSALGNHTVEVLDVESGKPLRTLTDLDEPQGLYFDSATNQLFVATGDGNVTIYDGAGFQRRATIKLTDDADNIRVDVRSGSIVVGYGGGKALRSRPPGSGALAFLSPGGNQSGEIIIDAHPESFQIERVGARVFVNVPDKNEIQVADVLKKTTLAHWRTAAATACFPMALDEPHQRLFVGCRNPARLLVVDSTTGGTLAWPEIVGDTDDLFYDAAKNRVYVIGGQGFIDVLQQKDADQYERIARYPTPPGTRTGLFVPEWGRLFAAVPRRGGQGCEILVYEAR